MKVQKRKRQNILHKVSKGQILLVGHIYEGWRDVKRESSSTPFSVSHRRRSTIKASGGENILCYKSETLNSKLFPLGDFDVSFVLKTFFWYIKKKNDFER